jgi:hypothetical protein
MSLEFSKNLVFYKKLADEYKEETESIRRHLDKLKKKLKVHPVDMIEFQNRIAILYNMYLDARATSCFLRQRSENHE